MAMAMALSGAAAEHLQQQLRASSVRMEAPLDTLGKIQLRLLEHRGADMLDILHKLSSAAVRNPSAYLKGLAKKQKMLGGGGGRRRRCSRRSKPSPDSI